MELPDFLRSADPINLRLRAIADDLARLPYFRSALAGQLREQLLAERQVLLLRRDEISRAMRDVRYDPSVELEDDDDGFDRAVEAAHKKGRR